MCRSWERIRDAPTLGFVPVSFLQVPDSPRTYKIQGGMLPEGVVLGGSSHSVKLPRSAILSRTRSSALEAP